MKIKLPTVTPLLATVALILIVFGTYATFFANDLSRQTVDVNSNTKTVNADALPIVIPDDSGIAARKMLMSSAKLLLDSNPLTAKTRMQVQLFDQPVVAHGNYWQMGQGTGSARLELSVPDDQNDQSERNASLSSPLPQELSMLQICHNGYYYRLQTTSEQPTLHVADLRRITEVDHNDMIANRNTWLATGGLSGFLETLATNFLFEPPTRIQVGDSAFWKLRGTWNESRLRRLLNGQVKYQVIRDEIKWSDLPKQLPHSCEILLSADDYFPLFPYRVSYFQQCRVDDVVQNQQVVSIEFYELQTNANLSNDLFEPGLESIRPNDLTSDFVQRIENLQRARRAAMEHPSSFSKR